MSTATHKTIVLAACLVAVGCSGVSPPDPYNTPEMSLEVVDLYDLQTGSRPEAITIDLRAYRPWQTREEFEAGELPSWSENFRVVRWPDIAPVEGTWTFTPDTHSGQMQFVPTRAFDDGWYALQIRPDRLSVPRGFYLQLGPAERDGWATVRFHVGSFPLLLLSGGVSHPEEGRTGGGDLSFVVTEPVFASSAFRSTDVVTISIDGVPLACSSVPEGREAGDRVSSVGFTCPDPGPPADLTIEVRPLDWRTESGAAIRPCGTNGAATWETVTGEYISREHCDLEALLRAPSP